MAPFTAALPVVLKAPVSDWIRPSLSTSCAFAGPVVPPIAARLAITVRLAMAVRLAMVAVLACNMAIRPWLAFADTCRRASRGLDA